METRRNCLLNMLVGVGLVGVIVLGRLLPHAPNFTPVAAVALFAGCYLNRKWALVLPLAGMVLSDLFLDNYPLRGRLVVYGALALSFVIGLVIRKKVSGRKVVLGSLAGSVLFFLITNCVFLYSPVMYPHSFTGQMASYYNGLPFFKWTVLGDLFYTGVLFGAYALVKNLYLRSRQNQHHSGVLA